MRQVAIPPQQVQSCHALAPLGFAPASPFQITISVLVAPGFLLAEMLALGCVICASSSSIPDQSHDAYAYCAPVTHGSNHVATVALHLADLE